MPVYYYDGPVMKFEHIVTNRWVSRTYAVSEKKARSNLTHQFKMENGLTANSKITLPGKIVTIEREEKINERTQLQA